ncbi:hypothetical protein PVAND_005777 [Polypedilum vanderplanki]|uniref:C2H2-type domain-containing protein n=1 Tax=Polypedilum vanderplanki TaxID=319348 RepID=A0A9J6C327_POLVA|nr:hypothetical protein PVAND_005777 [Polypedilum vanderplanki]
MNKSKINPSKASVLIVENRSGEVFIVEGQEKQQEAKKNAKNAFIKNQNNKKPENKQEQLQFIENNSDIKNEQECITDDLIIEEYLDEYFTESTVDQDFEGLPFISVDTSKLSLKTDEKPKISAMLDHQYTVTEIYHESTTELEITEITEFDNENTEVYTYEELPLNEDSSNYITSEIEIESFDEDGKKIPKKQYHKFHQLTGKAACKYCETIFKSKEMLKMHDCKYLQCDPKNFICRICNKELSRKTFSNHLHETTNCQYCNKSFVNPRNLKTHIKNLHKDEGFLPPKSPDKSYYKELEIDETEKSQIRLDEETGIITTSAEEKEKKKYVRKKGRFECELCGRIFSLARSLTQHLLLHSKTYRYVCETCGEKFTTRTGIIKHACLNRKRKRPEKDFRTVDVRHCKYCDLWFDSFEENKNHDCDYQLGYDPKMFKCRFCFLEMSKNSYNKHMSKHLDPNEYVCKLCDKKLACEKALLTHLTVHSGNKPFQCDHCDKSFINKTLLIRHSRFHGIDVPTYRCEVCDREVASKYHLKTHMLMHKEEVICQICKKEFSSRDKLKEHYQADHEPYRCSFCTKSFVLPRYLKMHEKLHKGNSTRQYACEFCSREFSKRSLANHVYKNHQENFNEWRDKNMDFITYNS